MMLWMGNGTRFIPNRCCRQLRLGNDAFHDHQNDLRISIYSTWKPKKPNNQRIVVFRVAEVPGSLVKYRSFRTSHRLIAAFFFSTLAQSVRSLHCQTRSLSFVWLYVKSKFQTYRMHLRHAQGDFDTARVERKRWLCHLIVAFTHSSNGEA